MRLSPRCLAGTVIALLCACESAPPASPAIDWEEAATGLEQQALADRQFVWHTLRGEAARVHYRPGSFAARHAVMLTRSADASVRRAIEIVGIEHYEHPVDVFFFDTRADLIAFVGVPATGYADWESSSVFLVFSPTWRAFDTHEIAHVVSINTWGVPVEPIWWIREGLAVYADGRCREHTVQALAAEYLRRGELPYASDLIYRFANVGEMPGYLGSGSLVGFLYETYGVEAIHRIWQQGGDAIETVTGASLNAIDARWRAWLENVESDVEPEEWRRVIDDGCG